MGVYAEQARSTMHTPIGFSVADEQARTAMLEHHAELRREFDERVAALRAAVAASVSHSRPLAALQAFLAESVLPHAAAEENTLYPVAAADAATGLLVDAMVTEHRALEERARRLAGVSDPTEALGIAEAAAAVFAVHVDKENDLLLPALARVPGVSLAGLLEAMHDRLTEPEVAAGER